jgi:hypothetical protein
LLKARIVLIGVAVAFFAAACGSGGRVAPKTTGSHPRPTGSGSPSVVGYHPVIDPANFQGVVDNPWFPLKPGSVRLYAGVKDGKPARNVFVVTHGTQSIDGVPCVIVHDQLFLSNVLTEDTTDYYTQDRQGNVWYFGESTVKLDDKGVMTDTEGSWLAGQDGAQPGIFMEANPTVGHSFRQEYYRGHAEDQFRVLSISSPVSVPYGSFKSALLTQETTAPEPTVVDHKFYIKGVGGVAELQVKGPQPPELLRLVSASGL